MDIFRVGSDKFEEHHNEKGNVQQLKYGDETVGNRNFCSRLYSFIQEVKNPTTVSHMQHIN